MHNNIYGCEISNFIKNIDNYDDILVRTDKRNNFFSYVFASSRISKRFNIERFYSYLPQVYINYEKYEQVLFSTYIQKKKVNLIGIKDNKIYINFDIRNLQDYLHYERYLKKSRPIYTRLPFSYTNMPVSVRNSLFDLLLKFKRITALATNSIGYPDWPIEPSLDLFSWSLYEIFHSRNNNQSDFSGASNKSLVILSHDIETNEGLKSISKVRTIERKFEMCSAWSLISKRYKIPDSEIKGLIAEGCEIVSHGYLHDGKLPYLEESEIFDRLQHLSKIKPWLKNEIKGFRSPQLLRNKKLDKAVSRLYQYDLTYPDTEKNSTMGLSTGVGTVYPFFNEHGTLIIPLTIPQDYYLMYTFKLKPREILNTWINKIEYIHKLNGISVINTHPDPYLSTKKMLYIYMKLLEYIHKKKYFEVVIPKTLYNLVCNPDGNKYSLNR